MRVIISTIERRNLLVGVASLNDLTPMTLLAGMLVVIEGGKQ